ncbi:MAG: hemerythrin domain-containing protein [Endomicrobiia bacterium]
MEYLTKIMAHKHEQIKEEFLFYKDVVSFVYHKNYGRRIEPMFKFFVKNILPHFKMEELIYMIIEKSATVKEQKIMKQIIDEHTDILKKLNNLKELAIKHNLSDLKTKNMFNEEFKKIVKTILAHAQKEDEKLFPIYKKYVNQKTIEKILASKNLEPYIKKELKKEIEV